MSSEFIGQACYTWAAASKGRQEGFCFVSASPSIQDKLPWLDAESKGLTNFTAGGREMDQSERDAYTPVGRHLGKSAALAYRKAYAGKDSHDRPGRYVVHFLVAEPSVLTLASLLRISPSWWPAPPPLKAAPQLADLLALSMVPGGRKLTPSDEVVEKVRKGIAGIAEAGKLDINDWVDLEMRVLLACLPKWCDASAALMPKWTMAGSTNQLILPAGPPSALDGPDGRDDVEHDVLLGIRARLSDASDISDLRDKLKSRAEVAVRTMPHISFADPADDRLQKTIDLWLSRGTRALDDLQRRIVTDDSLTSLRALQATDRKLPSGKRGDEIAVDLLRASPNADPELIAQILPSDDAAVAGYVAAITTPALLHAVLLLNGRDLRCIDIPVTKKLPDSLLANLVALAGRSDLVSRSLARTLRISIEGSGSFARAVLTANRVDYSLLYTKVLPTAAEGRIDTLLTMICINPEGFVEWTKVGPPYQDALVEALKAEESQDLWRRIYSLLAAGRK